MKKTFLILTAIALCNTIDAQNGCVPAYKKGQKLHYIRQDAPNILTAIPDYWKLKGKEKKEADERFALQVNTGVLQGKEYPFDMEISDIQTGGNGYVTTIEFKSQYNNFKSYVACKNDTIFGIRSLTGTPMVSDGETVGFIKPGMVIYPVNMKIGDVLPACTDLTYTFPKKIDASYKSKILDRVQSISTSQCAQGYCNVTTSTTSYYKEITKDLKYTLQFNAPTVTYRHVVGEEMLKVNGKDYKAFKIEMVMETKVKDVISDIEADDKLQKWTLEFLNGYIKNKANKTEGLTQSGNEWFVPELGLVVVSEVLDKDGKSQYKAIVKSID